MEVILKIVESSGEVRNFAVGNRPVRIGRDPSTQIVISDAHCSKVHASLVFQDGSLWLEDLNSKNGTSLNGIKIKKQRLFLGDVVMIGETKLAIDAAKNEEEIIQALTSEHQQRSLGEITLELETHQYLQQKKARKKAGPTDQTRMVKENKLYKGVAETNKVHESSKSQNTYARSLRIQLALFIDLVFAALVFGAGAIILESALLKFNTAERTGAALGAALLFHYWNRKIRDLSFGERLMKLD